MWLIAAALMALALGAQAQVAPSGTCALLTPELIEQTQAAVLRESRSVPERAGALRIDQCLFRTAAFERSVSVSVIQADGDAPGAVRDYWQRTFHRPARQPLQAAANRRPPREKNPPRRIDNLGEEAFWTGDPRTGALYVLTAGRILRISIGGVDGEEERLSRTTALSRAALLVLEKQGH